MMLAVGAYSSEGSRRTLTIHALSGADGISASCGVSTHQKVLEMIWAARSFDSFLETDAYDYSFR